MTASAVATWHMRTDQSFWATLVEKPGQRAKLSKKILNIAAGYQNLRSQPSPFRSGGQPKPAAADASPAHRRDARSTMWSTHLNPLVSANQISRSLMRATSSSSVRSSRGSLGKIVRSNRVSRALSAIFIFLAPYLGTRLKHRDAIGKLARLNRFPMRFQQTDHCSALFR